MSKNIAEAVRELLEETVNSCGVKIWDVEFVKEGPTKYLRVTIDKEKGITIEDCEKVHNAIDPLLDHADLIAERYNLEVTSPGIERSLKTPLHFIEFIGEQAEIKLYAKLDGRRVFQGTLKAFDSEKNEVLLEENGSDIAIPLSEIAKAKTIYDFK